jgi:DNA-binding Lrp family transcriptional regulator
MSFRKIAEEIGISTDTVIRRYERLVKSGAMKISIQINPEKLGIQANLDFSIAFAFQKETAPIVENLAKIPGVIIIIKTSGDFDLHVTSMVRDSIQQFEIQEEIAKIPNIAKMETAARRIPDKWPTNSQHISTF